MLEHSARYSGGGSSKILPNGLPEKALQRLWPRSLTPHLPLGCVAHTDKVITLWAHTNHQHRLKRTLIAMFEGLPACQPHKHGTALLRTGAHWMCAPQLEVKAHTHTWGPMYHRFFPTFLSCYFVTQVICIIDILLHLLFVQRHQVLPHRLSLLCCLSSINCVDFILFATISSSSRIATFRLPWSLLPLPPSSEEEALPFFCSCSSASCHSPPYHRPNIITL